MRSIVRLMGVRRTLTAVTITGVAALATLTGLSIANVNVSKSGWAWSNPTPQGRTLHAIAFAGGAGYAVGDGGTALSTSNAGHTWSGLVTGTSVNLERVQAVSASTVVVGGGAGCVTRISTDGGQIFKRIFDVAESNCPEPVAAFSFVSPTVGVLLLRNGAVEVTGDGGETFSRKTGVPGTSASSGGGPLVGTEVHFFSPTSGIAFESDPHSGVSAAYMTPDGGTSWTAVPLPAGARVTSVHFVDAKHGYAIGPETLLRTSTGGEKWEALPALHGIAFNSIDCASVTTCVLTVNGGNELVETTEKPETTEHTEHTELTEHTEHTEHTEMTERGLALSVKTASSALLFGAGYASSSQIVAVGAGGATVLSGDGGATFTPSSADIGGEYGKLRLGPGGILLAPGARGNLAISTNNGQSWQVLGTQTSRELADAAFVSPTLGYALDVGGGLQRTTNGGGSWQTLNAGTSKPARAIVAFPSNTVLLIGPVGVSRAVGGGRFSPVGGKVAFGAHLSDYDLVRSTVFAFGQGTHTLIRSTNEGAKWTAIRMPLSKVAKKGRHGKHGKHGTKGSPGVSVRSVAFTSAQAGVLLDTQGRVWSTHDGGKHWTEVLSLGTGEGVQLAFSDSTHGFLSVRAFGRDHGDAYVLRTVDGGSTWHPQEISSGSIPRDGLVASSALEAAALIDGPANAGEALNRFFFTTSSGGDVAGGAEALSLSTHNRVMTAAKLRSVHYSVRINGTLAGATGGETIVVSKRNLSGGGWAHQTVVAGANGGSFASTWVIRHSAVFVAQWSGDSGRPGEGSAALRVIITPTPKKHKGRRRH
jgi:photosystem II stability/assembly factor-like uncharacterized protein